MYFTLDELKQKFQVPLPGLSSQVKMRAPVQKAAELSVMKDPQLQAKNSAVLILLFPEDGNLKTVFIKRSEYDGVHSGQIAFPGGKHEKTDNGFKATALRETNEEIGIEQDKIEIIGQLTDLFIRPSNFLVKVFVGFSPIKLNYVPDEKEVQSVVEVDLEKFYNPNIISEKDFFFTSRKIIIKAPCYTINGIEIWGATAMIVSELLDVLKN